MKIIVQVKSVYGVEKIYPVCEVAKVFAEIAGAKTLTSQVIAKIQQLGYQVEIAHNSCLPKE